MADRTVTVRLNADIKPFAAEMAKAEAAAKRFRDGLGDVRIDVRADTASAVAQLASLQREVDRLSGKTARIDVDADTGRAQSQLASVGSSVSRLEGRRARVKVDADVGGALASIAMVGAALAALPSAVSIGVGVAGLGAAFAAAGAGAAGFAAVAVPSLGRINEALNQQASAAGGAGGATKSAAQTAAEAASRALQLEQAERRVTDAQKAVKQAQEDLTRARRDAKRAIEDYALSVKDAALAEEDAALSVREAQQRLAEVQADPEASDLERERAELNYRQAIQRLDEQQVRTKRLHEDKKAADKAGVEGSEQVKSAQDRLLQSQQDLIEAQKQLALTQLQQKAAMEQAGGAAGGAASKMAELSKAERALAKDIKAFQDQYVAWQRSLQPDVFPAIEAGLDVLRVGMDRATPLVKGGAKGLELFAKASKEALESRQWTTFFDDLGEKAPRAIEGLGNAALNVAGGLSGIVSAFLPYTDDISSWLEDVTQDFEDWGQSLKGSAEFEQFLAYARENGPKVAEIFGNIATFAGKLAEVGANLGPGVLDFLVTLSDRLADLDPAQVEAIAKSVGLIFAAAKLGASLKLGAFVLLAEMLAKMSPGQIEALAIALAATVAAVKGYQAISGAVGWWQSLGGSLDKAGKSADGAASKFANLGGVLKGGAVAAALSLGVAAADGFSDSVQGLNPEIDKLSKAMADFVTSGKVAPELLDQMKTKSTGINVAGVVDLASGFEDFADTAARLASDDPFTKIQNGVLSVVDSFDIVTLDNGAQAIDNLDEGLTNLVGNGQGQQAAQMFNRLAIQMLAAGTPVEELRDLFPQYTASLEGAVPKTGDMTVAMTLLGQAVDPTAVAMENFNSSMGVFNATTDAAQRTLELKDAFNEATQAIGDAGGKLDFTAQMTDKQKRAVIEARDQFGGYIEKVVAAAKAAGEMAGKTGEAALKSDEAREAFIRQLPQLFDLAGKSSAAREQIYKLAEGFGVNRTQADRAKEGVKGAQEVINNLKGKKVDVGADTKQAHEALNRLKLAILQMAAANVMVTLQAVQKKEAGGIVAYEQGGIEAYASGGVRSPHIATRPTVLYGEGRDKEAFIPYDTSYRSRAIGLLGQVADDFGLALYNKAASGQISTLTGALDTAESAISASLSEATSTLDATLGSAGSLTSTLVNVSAAGQDLAAGWVEGSAALGDSVTGMGETITTSLGDLSSSVTGLAEVIGEAASWSASQGSNGKTGTGKTTSPKGKGKPGPVQTGDKMGPTDAEIRARMAAQGALVPGGSLREAYGGSVPVNSSRVSRPQQMPASQRAYAPTGGSIAGDTGSAGAAAGRTGLVTIQGDLVVREQADADLIGAALYSRLGSKGP
ncbi:hypothetical protein [Nonomuraea sp. NPDC003804]|uniref:hypothetical protein n=1 Tax=Nonomuraea sp. NPDC003804 TaxID=3154547 RepID=UPI0033B897C8